LSSDPSNPLLLAADGHIFSGSIDCADRRQVAIQPTRRHADRGLRHQSAGVTVGVYRDAAGKFHGIQYDGESFGSVDLPGAAATRVFAINAGGDMVGAYVDTGGRTHGFLAQWVDTP